MKEGDVIRNTKPRTIRIARIIDMNRDRIILKVLKTPFKKWLYEEVELYTNGIIDCYETLSKEEAFLELL